MLTSRKWSPDSWRSYVVKQLGSLYDSIAKSYSLYKMKSMPHLVNYKDIQSFRERVVNLVDNKGFIIHMGECAESFDDFSESYVESYIELFNQVDNIFDCDVIKIGRLAGQFAKPRTYIIEKKGDKELPNYLGDMINSHEYTEENRIFDQNRILEAYAQSAITYNIIGNNFYISHEALILDYEQCFINQAQDNNYYSGSAHLLWVGKRTTSIDSAHIEFISGIYNPTAIKIADDVNLEELKAIIEKINPGPGKLILIGRYGSDKVEVILPKILQIIKNYPDILYVSDPMHGNSYFTNNGTKTRSIDKIKNELSSTYKILSENNIRLAGVMLEVTGEDVDECTEIYTSEDILHQNNYKSKCDPRLNREQTIDMLHFIHNLIRNSI